MKKQEEKKVHKRIFHPRVSLQVTAMIPLGHMGDPEGEHGLGEGSEWTQP